MAPQLLQASSLTFSFNGVNTNTNLDDRLCYHNRMEEFLLTVVPSYFTHRENNLFELFSGT